MDVAFNSGLMIFGDSLFLCQVAALDSHKVLDASLLVIFLGATCKLHRDVALSLFVLIDTGGIYIDQGG